MLRFAQALLPVAHKTNSLQLIYNVNTTMPAQLAQLGEHRSCVWKVLSLMLSGTYQIFFFNYLI